ncbi:MAG TPA: glycosyltransferase [Candidatus Dormibacteraeota bacterium]
MVSPFRDDPIRITYVIGSLEIGGAERQLVRLINGLDKSRFQPSLICLFGAGPLQAELDEGVTVASLRLPSLRRNSRRNAVTTAIRLLGAVRRDIRRQKPDIVHAYMMTAYVLAAVAGRAAGTRIIIGARRGLVTHQEYPYRRWRVFARTANRLIDFHLCNSEAVRQLAVSQEGIPVEKTGVIHNGLDFDVQSAPVGLDPEWEVGPGDGCAAMVANFHAYKGHLDVLAAVRLVVGRYPRFKLILFGDGAERTAIERYLQEHHLASNVVLAGARLDAANLLSAFDFSVLNSTQESFPNALMESMARGVPVISTRVGGVPELVRDGVDGILVESGNPEQLATAMLELLDDAEKRGAMGEMGRARIQSDFSVRSMITRTEAVYLDLLGRKQRRRLRPSS